MDTFQIKVTLNDQLYCGSGKASDSILEMLEQMQLPIRSSCRRGLCGSCSVVLVKGTLDDVCSVVEDGKVYSCKSYLLSDAEIHIKYT
ncbi:2Fe-2S iron-sulfur cluster-binding protein [Pseudoalteromonas piscicida]|uniref:2Fe-2S iron-sulfur cluster-binding protein n=2 Tax=Pseudoalteromonas piscicida TaxID=43662 RepID=UPI003CE56B71